MLTAAPPTRGWTPGSPRNRKSNLGCPAYAGMDPHPLALEWRNRRLPRLRGDGPLTTERLEQYGAAAPPTRGWTPANEQDAFFPSGCPAYAGMDPGVTLSKRPLSGLPRLRGDGPKFYTKFQHSFTAAPPTRGWTLGTAGR